MALNRVSCPECGAGLKSPTGFQPGQNVNCPKCETNFIVEEPAGGADDDLDLPKGKRADDASGRTYKNSPLRYAVLGVLVCVMAGLAVMLYIKKRDEARERDQADREANGLVPSATPPKFEMPLPGNPMPAGGGGGPGGPRLIPDKGPDDAGPGRPIPKKQPGDGGPGRPGGGGAGIGLPLFGDTPTLSGPDAAAKVSEYKNKLVGTWKAELGSGKKVELVYRGDGTFTETLTADGKPTTVTGQWTASGLVGGNRGILVTRTVGGAQTKVKAEFADDELLHDTPERGVVGSFRKQ